MSRDESNRAAVRGGDISGLRSVYTDDGTLILHGGEQLLGTWRDCDIAAFAAWRPFFARPVFHAYPGRTESRLYITTRRIVLLRKIDIWKEVKPLLTPLGVGDAVSEQSRLSRTVALHGREFCEVLTNRLMIKRFRERRTILLMKLIDMDGAKYTIAFYSPAPDAALFRAIEGRFQPLGTEL